MSTKRQVFYSFHYKLDNWRASQVRNIGAVEGNAPASDNDWEEVERGGNNAIRNWIDSQMQNRTCTIVLIGSETAGRKWINYEIEKSWDDGKGIVGIYIHGLKDRAGETSSKGKDPFDCLAYKKSSTLSSLAKRYDAKLESRQGPNSLKGEDLLRGLSDGSQKLSSVVKCYNPEGSNSQARYNWIAKNLPTIIEEAIAIRKRN